MSNFEDSLESLVEENDVDNFSDQFNEQDSIHSGESKLKNFKFDPKRARCPHDIQRTIDFWKFIQMRQDLFPQKGFKVNVPAPRKKKKCKEEELSWRKVLDLLKANNLDKVANRGQRELCKIETCAEAAERDDRTKLHSAGLPAGTDECLDDFTLDNLDDFDPQKVSYADAEIQTDAIETEDKETQTDFRDSRMEQQDRLKELDGLLKEVADADLTGYFDCICDDPCAFLPYATTPSVVTSAGRRPSLDKCTCSCGVAGCLCSLCAEILARIASARDSFERLSAFEIAQCPCATIGCDCLADYRQLLDVKLEINRAVREAVQDEHAHFGPPMRCRCACQQASCPCKIVMQLFVELDELMGYKEKPLLYYEKAVDMTFGVDVCRCDGEYADEPCACLSFYRKQIQDKIDAKSYTSADSESIVRSRTLISTSECSRECLDECTLETCPKVAGNVRISDDAMLICPCTNKDCIPIPDTSTTIIAKSDSELVYPATPCNSITSL